MRPAGPVIEFTDMTRPMLLLFASCEKKGVTDEPEKVLPHDEERRFSDPRAIYKALRPPADGTPCPVRLVRASWIRKRAEQLRQSQVLLETICTAGAPVVSWKPYGSSSVRYFPL